MSEQKVTPAQKAPFTGAMSGFLRGLLVGLFFFFIGNFFFVGIGVPPWVAMTIAAICPIWGAVIGSQAYRTGKCPYCGAEVSGLPKNEGMNCPTCKQRIIVTKDEFQTVPK